MKILIYRGETLQTEHELGAQVLRIGRSPENDIVLEDPGKGVSRHHAEIRPQDGGYALVDLGSQNGIWVHGARVPSVKLEAGVAAAVGPYRLTVPEEAVTAAVPPISEPPIDPTEYVDPRVLAAAGGRMLDPAAETGPVEAILPPSPPTPAAERGSGGSTVRPASRDGGSSTVRSSPNEQTTAPKSRLGLFAAAAVLLIGAAAVGAYELVWHRPTPKPVWSRDVATALVGQGRCQEAIAQQIGPALAANPADPDAIALKARCAPPPTPPPGPTPGPAPAPPPIPDPTAQALDAADASLAAKDCQATLDAVTPIIANAPDNARALDLKAKAEDCLKATVRIKPPAPVVATAMPPGQGGLDVQQGEAPAAYAKRVQKMKERYDAAVALAQAQHYRQALAEFDAITGLVPAGYRDLAHQQSVAREALRAEAAQEYQAGQQAEQTEDFASAVRHYQRARDLDASHDVSPDLARVTDLKTRRGHEACQKGDAYFMDNHNTDAAAQYTKALQMLPESDPCYVKAQQRLAIIHR